MRNGQTYKNELRILCMQNFSMPLDALKLLAKRELDAPAEDVQDVCTSLLVVR